MMPKLLFVVYFSIKYDKVITRVDVILTSINICQRLSRKGSIGFVFDKRVAINGNKIIK